MYKFDEEKLSQIPVKQRKLYATIIEKLNVEEKRSNYEEINSTKKTLSKKFNISVDVLDTYIDKISELKLLEMQLFLNGMTPDRISYLENIVSHQKINEHKIMLDHILNYVKNSEI